VINRWHKHGLDQYDFPSMLTEPFGGGGLNQIGLSIDYLLPRLWADEQSLVIQVTNSMNGKAFSGDWFSIPSGLVRLRSYWDLNRDTYLDFGITGLFGANNARGKVIDAGQEPAGDIFDAGGNQIKIFDAEGNPITMMMETPGSGPTDDAWRLTAFCGADLTLNWEPVNKAKYHSVTWRTEFLYGYKQQAGGKNIHWIGGYSYIQGKVWRNWIVGARGEVAEPFGWSMDTHYVWQFSPYVTWWQSPWVRTHLEYQLMDGDQRPMEHRVIFQAVFAAGPHKHERY